MKAVSSALAWTPDRYPVERSNLRRLMTRSGTKSVHDLIEKSANEIEWFWEIAAKDLALEWFKPYERVLDSAGGVEWAKWFVGGRINICHNCVDRHSRKLPNKLAIVWFDEQGAIRELSYSKLHAEVCKFANGLKSLGVQRGDRVALYLQMMPEVVVAMFACFKIGAICVPIFSGFGPPAVAARLTDVGAKILVTSDGIPRRGSILDLKSQANEACKNSPSIKRVIVVRRTGQKIDWVPARDIWWDDLLSGESAECETVETDSEDYSLVLYSSGTTGKPKGTVHTHVGALIECTKQTAYEFDIHQDDVFAWVTDIGWMMGPWMLIGGLFLGATVVMFEGAIDYPSPGRLWQIIEKAKITVFGISPTVIRTLRKYGDDIPDSYDLTSLRVLGSTGEPWDEDSWNWYFTKIGHSKCPNINISGGTELIGGNVSPTPLSPLKPCTVGGPALGMDVDVFNEEGKPVRGEVGYLVMKKPCPSMTKGFWNDPQRYLETYWSRWPGVWLHGDWALVDQDGFWFILGRADDTIKLAGRRVGPGEVEAALISSGLVAEAAAIGIPDAIRGEALLCFVVPKPTVHADDSLKERLAGSVSSYLGKAFAPKEIIVVTELPRTRSGKIVRRLIKKKFLGEENLGDLSTIDNPAAFDQIKPTNG